MLTPSMTPLDMASYTSITGVGAGVAPRALTVSPIVPGARIVMPFKSSRVRTGFLVIMTFGVLVCIQSTSTSFHSLGLNV